MKERLPNDAPASAADAPSACCPQTQLISLPRSGSRGTRADQGVRPTIYAGFADWEIFAALIVRERAAG